MAIKNRIAAPLSGVLVTAAVLLAPGPAGANVSHTTGLVDGVLCDIWTWTDSHQKPRTVALKMEGNGNPGHGGYAVRMTYYRRYYYGPTGPAPTWQKMTVDAAKERDGGFGYFVSHERFRFFDNGDVDTIASEIFGTDDSPLGLDFPAASSIPLDTAAAGAESFVIGYGHYGTKVPWAIDPGTGEDSPRLPTTASSFAFYPMPVTTTWVFQDGRDFLRLDITVDLSQVVPPGQAAPAAGLVNFDVRGPYGVMLFDDDKNGVIGSAVWGDQTNRFTTRAAPVTRSSRWKWSAGNAGARYTALIVGATGLKHGRFEMGLFEPAPALSASALADGYAAERGFTSTSYAAAGGVSVDACAVQHRQTLPSDGEWPYQSVQYSLPCPPTPNFLTKPTTGKKIAWGSSAYYGSELSEVFNGFESLPINAFPADNRLSYSVCLVLSWDTNYPRAAPPPAATPANAALYTEASPSPANSDCATAAVP